MNKFQEILDDYCYKKSINFSDLTLEEMMVLSENVSREDILDMLLESEKLMSDHVQTFRCIKKE